MLTSLVIQDVVLIDKLSLALGDGLNVFTGETGAGKSILLGAIGLALGARAEGGLVRQNAKQASVCATFEGPTPPALFALLDAQGLDGETEGPLVLRRVLMPDGKSRAFFNDQPIGVSLLKKIGEALLEIHGQFETHGLLDPGTHKDMLDAFGGLGPLAKEVALAHRAWRQTQNALAQRQQAKARAKAEEEFLRAALTDLQDLAPVPGEAGALTERRKTLQNKEKILDALKTATAALEGHRGAVAALGTAGKTLARMEGQAESLTPILALVDRASEDAGEAARLLNREALALDEDGVSLDSVEERLFALRAAARKHGTDSDSLPDVMESFAQKLRLLQDEDDALSSLAKEADAARHAFMEKAKSLSAARAKAALKLAAGVQKELPPLKLEHARFDVALEPLPEEQAGEGGLERAAFLVSTNPGAPFGPLHKIASGGELARLMLALKVVLAAADPVPTLVFDEVDAGLGGRTADAVGERLARLGQSVQVLVVTHSPQVAARGAHHWQVSKTAAQDKTTTNLVPLEGAARVEELARMLAGRETTDAARDAALALLGNPPPAKKKRGA